MGRFRESEGNINALRALAPPSLRLIPRPSRPSRPQPRTPPPAGAAGTAWLDFVIESLGQETRGGDADGCGRT
jgi:hypothetical protein